MYHRNVTKLYVKELIQKTAEVINNQHGHKHIHTHLRKYPEHINTLSKVLDIQPWIIESAIMHNDQGNGLTLDVITMCMWLKAEAYKLEVKRIEQAFRTLEADPKKAWKHWTD